MRGWWWKIPTAVLGLLAVIGAYTHAGPAMGFSASGEERGDLSRIIFFHVPYAWVATIGFVVAMIHSVNYLRTRKLDCDLRANAAVQLGTAYCLVATISGSVFAKYMWGSAWNWDPRETSIFILLTIYVAYMALRATVEEPVRRARLAAVYAIVASVTVPFLVFVVPRVYISLHPDPIINPRMQLNLDNDYRIVLFGMILATSGLFAWMMDVAVRIQRLAEHRADRADDALFANGELA